VQANPGRQTDIVPFSLLDRSGPTSTLQHENGGKRKEAKDKRGQKQWADRYIFTIVEPIKYSKYFQNRD
jgi:hypothetical protein